MCANKRNLKYVRNYLKRPAYIFDNFPYMKHYIYHTMFRSYKTISIYDVWFQSSSQLKSVHWKHMKYTPPPKKLKKHCAIYTAKNASGCSGLMRTGLNNDLLHTLFLAVNNIEQYCYTRFRLNNIVQYCSILFNIVNSQEQCVQQNIVQACSHHP